MMKKGLVYYSMLAFGIVILFISSSSAFWPFTKQASSINAQVINPIPINAPFPNTAKCIDSDGGTFSEVAGNVSVKKAMQWGLGNKKYNVYNDFCRGNNLTEFYCDKGTAKSTKIKCEGGCEKGKCKIQSKNLSNYCTDFNASDYYASVEFGPNIGELNEKIVLYLQSWYLENKKIYLSLLNLSGAEMEKVPLSNPQLNNITGVIETITSFNAPNKSGEYILSICGQVNIGKVNIKQNLCKPLYNANNERNKDRINVIFVGLQNYPNLEIVKNISKRLVSIDGNYRIVPSFTDSNSVYARRLDWGMLAIEPLKSLKNKFNFWYVDTLVNSSGFIIPEFAYSLKLKSDFCGLNNVYIAILSNNLLGASARLPSFRGKENIEKDSISFGESINYYQIRGDGELDVSSTTFVHETSHAIFGLPDEYNREVTGKTTGIFPSCAENISQARLWWGDLLGQVDTFFYEYYNASNKNGFDVLEKEDFTVKYIYGGCVHPEGDFSVLRPTNYSIMGNGYNTNVIPVYGSVNKRRVEQILNLFKGE